MSSSILSHDIMSLPEALIELQRRRDEPGSTQVLVITAIRSDIGIDRLRALIGAALAPLIDKERAFYGAFLRQTGLEDSTEARALFERLAGTPLNALELSTQIFTTRMRHSLSGKYRKVDIRIQSLAKLCTLSAAELLKIRGVGRKMLQEMQLALQQQYGVNPKWRK